MIKVYDAGGNEKDMQWVKDKYNLPDIIEAARGKDHWEVVALHEVIGPSSMTVRMVGEKIAAVAIVFGWPDGYVLQMTDVNGQTGFGMGGGAYYRPDRGETGPHFVHVVAANRDFVDGLGMIGKTNHAHLEPTFQFVKAQGPPEPPEDGWKEKYEGDHKALLEIHAITTERIVYSVVRN